MDCAQILMNLHIGAFPKSPGQIDELLEHLGITAVINLQTPTDMRAFDNLDWDEMRTHYAIRGIRLFHLPVQDLDRKDLQRRLADCVRVLETLIVSGHSVYVHSTESSYRAPTVGLAYLHWSYGWPLKKAVDHLKDRRACSPDLDVVRAAKAFRRAAGTVA